MFFLFFFFQLSSKSVGWQWRLSRLCLWLRGTLTPGYPAGFFWDTKGDEHRWMSHWNFVNCLRSPCCFTHTYIYILHTPIYKQVINSRVTLTVDANPRLWFLIPIIPENLKKLADLKSFSFPSSKHNIITLSLPLLPLFSQSLFPFPIEGCDIGLRFVEGIFI